MEEELEAPDARRLYVSLSGTDREDWTRALVGMGAALFVAGLLVGLGVGAGLRKRDLTSRNGTS